MDTLATGREDSMFGEDSGDANASTTTNIPWRSLLLRAEHCQALWQEILQQLDAETNTQGSRRININATAQRVDQACRKAYEQAELAKASSQQQQQPGGDLIDRIFFPSKDGRDPKEGEEEEEDEDVYDGLLKEEDDSQTSSQEAEPSASAPPQHEPQSSTKTSSSTTTGIADLQKAQREQMEDAIAAMAARMKEATQGIQSQLQQQTTQTLEELETVAEQNVLDVTKVTQNLQQHNQRQSQRNWGSWALIFTVVGVFCFCLLTIFTIPKRPDTCLILCGKDQTSLVGWFAQPVRVLSQYTVQPAYSLYQDLVSSNRKDEDPDVPDIDSAAWEKIYQENEAERLQKERLDQLLHSLHNDKGDAELPKMDKTKSVEKEAQKVDWREALLQEGDGKNDSGGDPFGGRKPRIIEGNAELEDNKVKIHDPLGGRKPVLDKDIPTAQEKAVLPDGRIETISPVQEKPAKVQDVNMNDLLASLNQAAQKTKAEDPLKDAGKPPFQQQEVIPPEDLVPPPGEVDPIAKRRVSPKDIRVAASKGDAEKLQSLLELQPGYIDRHDKKKMTALHLAAQKGHTEVVRLLLQHGASLSIENKEGKMPVDVAEAFWGSDHPIVQLLRNPTEGVNGNEDTSIDTSTNEVIDKVVDEKVSDDASVNQEPKVQTPSDEDVAAVEESTKTSMQNEEATEERRDHRSIIRSLLESPEDTSLDSEAYLKAGRQRLEMLVTGQAGGATTKKAQFVPVEDQCERNMEECTEHARKRLAVYLGS